MRYVAARAEAIPFEDGHFDVVSAFNSLDHVEDVDRAAVEIGRVLAPGGLLLMIVEVGHPASVTEPLTLTWELTEAFAPRLRVLLECRLEKTGGVNDSVLHDPAPYVTTGPDHPGLLVAKLERTAQ
jgi:ubiquinone/menaquinone biosynthesis C-methylase UbiE